MQSKPQLSAEIEKLFDEEFTVAEIWGMPLPNYNGRKIIYEDEALNAVKEHNKKVKHFLATALEEQRKAINDEWLYQKANDHDARIRADERAKVLREVEELLMDETLISYASWRRSTRKYGGTQEEYERLEDILNNQNQLRAELRTKLNQLKGKNDHRTND